MRSAMYSPIPAPTRTKISASEMNAAVEIVDLAVDVALPVRERDGKNHFAPAGADRRGRDGVGERPDPVFADETR